MFELNEKNLATVSGGWGSKKIVKIDNKNSLDIDLKHIYLGKNSSFTFTVVQTIG